jgi:hypothetical protein
MGLHLKQVLRVEDEVTEAWVSLPATFCTLKEFALVITTFHLHKVAKAYFLQ